MRDLAGGGSIYNYGIIGNGYTRLNHKFIRRCCDILDNNSMDYCGRDFPLRMIRRSIHTTSEKMSLECKCKAVITTQKKDGDTEFLCENSNREKTI